MVAAVVMIVLAVAVAAAIRSDADPVNRCRAHGGELTTDNRCVTYDRREIGL